MNCIDIIYFINSLYNSVNATSVEGAGTHSSVCVKGRSHHLFHMPENHTHARVDILSQLPLKPLSLSHSLWQPDVVPFLWQRARRRPRHSSLPSPRPSSSSGLITTFSLFRDLLRHQLVRRASFSGGLSLFR